MPGFAWSTALPILGCKPGNTLAGKSRDFGSMLQSRPGSDRAMNQVAKSIPRRRHAWSSAAKKWIRYGDWDVVDHDEPTHVFTWTFPARTSESHNEGEPPATV